MVSIPKNLAVASKGILKNNHLLSIALQADIGIYQKKYPPQAVLAWGQKPSSHKAKALAHKLGVPLLTIEDGFLRSLDSGTQSKFAASFVVDDLGIYFDLTAPNRLQSLIADTMHTWDDDKYTQSERCIQKLLTHQLSKYNSTTFAPDLTILAGNQNPHVIIIDQVQGDASVAGAGSTSKEFLAMVGQAQILYPNANLWIKAHPAGKGYLDNVLIHNVRYLTEPCNPIALLTQAQAVFTVSSHMGFEALMLGKTVHCFGVNWYAGFGLTIDEAIKDSPTYQAVKAHHHTLGIQTSPTVAQLFYASYIAYSHYVNPATCQACDIEEVMAYLLLNRTWQLRLAGDVLAYEFSRWKVGFVKGFVGFDKVALSFKAKTKLRLLLTDRCNTKRVKRDNQQALSPLLDNTKQQYLVWGLAKKKHLSQVLTQLSANLPSATIWCMEDGFIRSNGLGAGLLEPLSVVVDDIGIYYDTTQPSRLEQILTTISLTKEQCQRAKKLQAILLDKRVSKYNVGTQDKAFFEQLTHLQAIKPNAKVRLVVGQVEDDASVQNCTSQIRTNGKLLADVCQKFPQDIIIYKPHPDVEAGLRVGKVDERTLCKTDLVAHHISMPDCLSVCQVVHTISSLTGFEALIRGLEVVCYGLPFYAGFGLTQEVVETNNLAKHTALTRRKRTHALTLDELIFATLIAYPLYRLPHGHGLTTPEAVIDYLYTQNTQQTHTMSDKFKRLIKLKVMRVYKTITNR